MQLLRPRLAPAHKARPGEEEAAADLQRAPKATGLGPMAHAGTAWRSGRGQSSSRPDPYFQPPATVNLTPPQVYLSTWLCTLQCGIDAQITVAKVQRRKMLSAHTASLVSNPGYGILYLLLALLLVISFQADGGREVVREWQGTRCH